MGIAIATIGLLAFAAVIYKLRNLINGQKIVSGVVLVCVVVPSLMYMKDSVMGTADLNKVSAWVCNLVRNTTGIILDREVDAAEQELNLQLTGLDADIADVEKALAMFDSSASEGEELTGYLQHLINERKLVLDKQEQRFKAMNEARIVREESRSLVVRQTANNAQWESAKKILKWKLLNQQIDAKADLKFIEPVVNKFLDAVESGSLQEAKSLATTPLKGQLTASKLKLLQKNCPQGELKYAKTANGYEVICDDELVLKLVKVDGTWKVAKPW